MSRRIVVSTIAIAVFATACSAIVAGQLGDTGDFKKEGASSSGTSGTSGGQSSECSLLKNSSGIEIPDASNTCSECIATQCAAHVEYACQAGGDSKPWFDTMSGCAQKPWDGWGPSGSSFWGCGIKYRDAGPPIPSNDDNQKMRESERCINERCMQGTRPQCKLCEPSIADNLGGRKFLRVDPCGKCIATQCEDIVVRCCSTQAVAEFVTECAFTTDDAHKAECQKRRGFTDGGLPPHSSRYDTEDEQCLADLMRCFNDQCKTLECPP
jgi:hypothetical protein